MGSSQVKIGRIDFGNRDIGLCNFSKNFNFAKISTLKNYQSSSFRCSSKSSAPFLLKASANVQTEPVVSGNRRSKPVSPFCLSLFLSCFIFEFYYFWS